jgi:serine/threonine protein kinase
VMDAVRRELPRSTLGRYRLICELGSGGMAHVYLALTTGLGGFSKLAVLKVMRAELAQNPEAVKLFLGEARLAARFNHPNVVQTTEVGEDAGCYFISMEYLEGLPLGSLLSKTGALQLPLAARLEIACQMLDGLGYLHELSDLDGSPLSLVHRDISPSNVFVTFEGTVKLLDFGVAKAAGVTEVSVVGSFKGKLGYAAPEQLRGESDSRSDIFTAGLLLWEMLSYRRLSLDRQQTEIVRGRVAGVDAELMRTRDRGLAAQLLDICVKAAAPRPEDRYQSASALREALRSYMREHALHSSAEDLRLLLSDRFDLLRQATRKNIDQRLKEAQLQDASVSPSTGPRSNSHTPHPFVDSSQHGSFTLQPASRARRLLVPAGGLAIVVTAALIGALVARSARRGSVFAVDRPRDTSSAQPELDLHHDQSSAPGGSVASRTSALDERETMELDDDRTQRHGSKSVGAAATTPSHRAESRAFVRPRLVPRGLKDPIAQGAPAPSGRSLPEAPRSSASAPSGPSDFAHRDSNKSARPIDTSSPYSD